jgi:hypothetical protein
MQQEVAPGIANSYEKVRDSIPADTPCASPKTLALPSLFPLMMTDVHYAIATVLSGVEHDCMERVRPTANLVVIRQNLLKAVFAVGMLAFAMTMPKRSEDIMIPTKCSAVHNIKAELISGLCMHAKAFSLLHQNNITLSVGYLISGSVGRDVEGPHNATISQGCQVGDAEPETGLWHRNLLRERPKWLSFGMQYLDKTCNGRQATSIHTFRNCLECTCGYCVQDWKPHRYQIESKSKKATDSKINCHHKTQQSAPLHVQAYELKVIR